MKSKIFTLTFITLIFLTFSFSQQSGYRKSWALIIGINEYQSLPPLTGAVKSAKMIREKLVREFGFEAENVIELYDDHATRENILKAFDRLMDPKRIGKDDRVLIYFAGHGVTRTVGGKDKGYIMPVDGVMEKFASTAISTDQLHEFQEAIPAKHVFFAMDACYSGTIFTRGIGLRESIPTSRSEAIAQFTSKSARVAITAGGKDEQVVDLADQGISVFAFYFLRGLDGESDLNRDEIITSSELADYIAKNVRFRAPQNPQYGKLPGDDGGEFIFVRSAFVSVEQKEQEKQPDVVARPLQPQGERKPQGRVVERRLEKEKQKIYWLYAFAGRNMNFYSIQEENVVYESTSGDGNLVGIGFESIFEPWLILSVNAFYDQKDGNLKIRGGDIWNEVRLSYTVTNLVIKLTSYNFYSFFGLSLGISTEIKQTIKSGRAVLRESKIETPELRLSVPFGIGYDLKIGDFKFFAEIGYDYGLTNVAKDVKWRVSSMQIMFGTRLGL
ncbi:MAG: caspase family protein [Candidatus Kryptonium sp.]|nr:caspase family protein [Candidatus Kryptonium sp.]